MKRSIARPIARGIARGLTGGDDGGGAPTPYERITNGGLDDDSSWDTSRGGWSINGGYAELIEGSQARALVQAVIDGPVAAGLPVQVSIDNRNNDSFGYTLIVSLRLNGVAVGATGNMQANSQGTNTGELTPAGPWNEVWIYTLFNSDSGLQIDNVSLIA